MYGANYGYRSGLNRSMVEHLHQIAAKIKTVASLRPGDTVLDIGSNDGTFLKAMGEPGVALIGMDPTGSKFREFYLPPIHLVPDFFSADRFRRETDERAKVVTSIAMFYDLESPMEFVRQVAEVLADDGIWVFEQSYLPAMLENTSYDTICHEHLEYYALRQILWMTDRAGLEVIDIERNDINGGSFCITTARCGSTHRRNHGAIAAMLEEEERLGLSGPTVYARFRERTYRHREQLRQFLEQATRAGELVLGYGASTKGNVILQFCGLSSKDLPFIADVNRDKFGAFTPGTRIPIISEEEARGMNPAAFLVLPWHFRANIIGREERFLKSGGKLVFPLPAIEVTTLENSACCRL